MSTKPLPGRLPEDLKLFRAPRRPIFPRLVAWAAFLTFVFLSCHAGAAWFRGVKPYLLGNSGSPASLGECDRTFPARECLATISLQHRTNEPWHHRTCWCKG